MVENASRNKLELQKKATVRESHRAFDAADSGKNLPLEITRQYPDIPHLVIARLRRSAAQSLKHGSDGSVEWGMARQSLEVRCGNIKSFGRGPDAKRALDQLSLFGVHKFDRRELESPLQILLYF